MGRLGKPRQGGAALFGGVLRWPSGFDAAAGCPFPSRLVLAITDMHSTSPKAKRRLRVLFTEGGSLSARQSLYAVGPLHEIDVLDPDPLCQCRFSNYVRRWIRSPSFSQEPEAFLRFLAERVREGQYDVVLPTHEQVYLLSRYSEVLSPYAGLALPDFPSLERLHNKADFSRLLNELDLPQPDATIVRHRAELDAPWTYPFYLKLAHSTAGSGVFFIADSGALDRRADSLQRKGLLNGTSEVLLQQPARGVQSTVQAVFDRGRIVGIHSFESRRLGVGGMSAARVSVDHPLVREQVERIGKHLDWHGAVFLDYFFEAESGQPQYIEANPRIGETVNALLSGVNLPELLVRVSCGESPAPAPVGRVGTRTQSFLMIVMSAAFDGQSRRMLLREIADYRAGRGIYENSEDELTRPGEDPLSRLPRLWTISQLLAQPARAKRIVAKTVKNYSLPESATERIQSLPQNLLDGMLPGRDERAADGATEPAPDGIG